MCLVFNFIKGKVKVQSAAAAVRSGVQARASGDWRPAGHQRAWSCSPMCSLTPWSSGVAEHQALAVRALEWCASIQYSLKALAQGDEAQSLKASWELGQRFLASAEWGWTVLTLSFFFAYFALCQVPRSEFYLSVVFKWHHLLLFYSGAPKNWKWKESSHIFSAHVKKKKQQKAHNKKSIGLSLTFGNPDILCTKVSDIKADCFHAYISNIICFTSVYAQAS